MARPDPLPIDTARRSDRRRRRAARARRASPTAPWCARRWRDGHEHAHQRAARRRHRGDGRGAPGAGRRDRRGLGGPTHRRRRARRAARSPTWRSSTPGCRAPPAASCSRWPAWVRGSAASTRPTACASGPMGDVLDAVRALGADGARGRRPRSPPGRGRGRHPGRRGGGGARRRVQPVPLRPPARRSGDAARVWWPGSSATWCRSPTSTSPWR